MKIYTVQKLNRWFFVGAIARVFLTAAMPADGQNPRTNCWFTTYAGQYARVYTNTTMQLAGTALTTWSNGSLSQSLPACCGVPLSAADKKALVAFLNTLADKRYLQPVPPAAMAEK